MLGNRFLKTLPVLLLILLVAFLLRIINVTNNPPALYGDELTMLLDVNSILHTGYDQTGKFLPLNFTMGGGRPVGYGYFSIPLVIIFGPGVLGVRLLSVFSGLGIVFLIYVLGRILFSSRVGLLAAFLMAISPWDLSMSRAGFETHFGLFLALVMVTLLLSGKKMWFVTLSALSFGISINTYSTYKLTLPLFLPILFWFTDFKEKIRISKYRLYLIAAGSILLFFLMLLTYQIFLNNSESRFLDQNIFANNDIETSINQKLRENKDFGLGNSILGKIISNKYWEYGSLITKNYLNSFSMDFLFITGDKNPRHNMASSGSLYLVELITILFGFAYLVKKENLRRFALIGSWLIIGPLPAALLNDPHALRSSFMLPSLILVSSLGLSYVWSFRNYKTGKLLLSVIFIGLLFQFIFVVRNLYFINPNKFSGFWAYPARKAAELVIQNQKKYDYIFLSSRIDDIEFAYPVYGNISPTMILDQNKNQTQIGEYKFKKYGNVYIGPIPDSAAQKFLDNLHGVSILYIGPQSDTKYLKIHFDVYNGKDNKEALVVKTISKND